MTSVVVIGSCLTNLPCLFLMADYKWVRPNNAAVLRSDHFVEKFLDQQGYTPPYEEFLSLIRWKPGMETEGVRWLRECYRETVGHLETPASNPGLFETLGTTEVDLVLMDNLHDTHSVMLYRRPEAAGPHYSLPVSTSRCENEQEIHESFTYSSPLEPAESVKNWTRIIRFVQAQQPNARIIFFCAHTCTMTAQPERRQRAIEFHALLAPLAEELGITVVAPIDLPVSLTKLPADTDHFELPVYRAMAGQIFLSYVTGKAPQETSS